ncbi:DedA family protein [Actinoplanes sp. RD1]|uniref:DedA family protein n=1 Tax=Actinoplanes sp. RD1 TaxID=3064538 RepID=UPI0027413296|nr:VTT domain-containing protein [Actinoplanes sp. RD1]
MVTQALTEQLALNPMDPKDLLQTFGLIGVWAILFAETGLLVGFFFPGDSLLFLAGVAASPVADSIFGDGTRISLAGLLIGAPLCAIIGAQLGHFLGARYGKRMFDRQDSKLFKREYVEKAEYYFEKFGPAKAVVLARFIPIVRTFLNPVAGTLGMPAKQFLLWNIVGAILWTDGVLLIGYLLAQQIYDAIGDKIDHYILPVVFVIVVISVLPILIEALRERKAKKRAALENPGSSSAAPGDSAAATADEGPGPVAAIGVVAAATVAGLAEEFTDHHQQQPGAAEAYGQPQDPYAQEPYGHAGDQRGQTYGGQSYGGQSYGGQTYGGQTYGQSQDSYGQSQESYGRPQDSYGQPASYGQSHDPYAQPQDPYAQPQDPYAQPQDPYAQEPYGQAGSSQPGYSQPGSAQPGQYPRYDEDDPRRPR